MSMNTQDFHHKSLCVSECDRMIEGTKHLNRNDKDASPVSLSDDIVSKVGRLKLSSSKPDSLQDFLISIPCHLPNAEREREFWRIYKRSSGVRASRRGKKKIWKKKKTSRWSEEEKWRRRRKKWEESCGIGWVWTRSWQLPLKSHRAHGDTSTSLTRSRRTRPCMSKHMYYQHACTRTHSVVVIETRVWGFILQVLAVPAGRNTTTHCFLWGFISNSLRGSCE